MRLQRIQRGIVISIILMSAPIWAQESPEIDDGDPQNGLSSQAFRRNALTTNKRALGILASHALNDALFTDHEGYISRQINDPNAQAVMSEIVKCALNAATSLSFPGPPSVPRFVWPGELGLCQDWSQGAPSQTCQELVTACVMARVNALQKAIPIWLRGYDREFSSVKPVPTVRVFRESPPELDPAQGTSIPSFDRPPACTSDDCRWKPRHVGKCLPGYPVALRFDVPANQHWEARVCAGIHGCTATSTGAPTYSWRIDEFPQPPVGNSNQLIFSCPVELLVGGYYSVMMRSDAPEGTSPPELYVNAQVYSAPRKDVFGFLEGAFFGNMFLRDKLTRDCEVVEKNPEQMTCRSGDGQGNTEVCMINCGITACRRDAGPVPYTNVHACYSLVQEQDIQSGGLGIAYLNSRICDRPDAGCFAEPPGPCTGDQSESARCTQHIAGGAFADCSSPADRAKTFPPITTYINGPCDLIGDGILCDDVRDAITAKPPCGLWLWLVRWWSWLLGGFVVLLAIIFYKFRDRLKRQGGSDAISEALSGGTSP